MLEGNSFLVKPAKGLGLIGKVVGQRKTKTEERKEFIIRHVDRLLDEQMLDALNAVGLEQELEFSDRLKKISDKVEEIEKFKLLRQRAVVGIGGQFSAGKSTFINSFLKRGEAILPRGITATTSISTYIIYGNIRQNRAYTTDHRFVGLSDEEYQALTHEFSEKYVGLSKFVDNIIIESKNFADHVGGVEDDVRITKTLWKHIALLDTPGYNKSTERQQERFTDRKQAEKQLSNADFVIWLLSVENGDLKDEDIKFLRCSLGDKLDSAPEKILIVINKAGKKTSTQVEEILQQVENTLHDEGIFVQVTAYDSHQRKEFFNEAHIATFLKAASEYGRHKTDLREELQGIQAELEKSLDDMDKKEKKQETSLYNAILNAGSSKSIGTMVDAYLRTLLRQRVIQVCKRRLRDVNVQIDSELRKLEK